RNRDRRQNLSGGVRKTGSYDRTQASAEKGPESALRTPGGAKAVRVTGITRPRSHGVACVRASTRFEQRPTRRQRGTGRRIGQRIEVLCVTGQSEGHALAISGPCAGQ